MPPEVVTVTKIETVKVRLPEYLLMNCDALQEDVIALGDGYKAAVQLNESVTSCNARLEQARKLNKE